MVVIKPEDLNIVEEDSEEDVDHQLIKDSVLELASSNFLGGETEEVGRSLLRRNAANSFHEEYRGKPVTRERLELGDPQSQSEGSEGEESQGEESEGGGSQGYTTGSEEATEEDGDFQQDSDEEQGFSDSDAEKETKKKSVKESIKQPAGIKIYSDASKDIASDIEKGKSIKNQLSIWDQLVEYRIKIQKAVAASNKLYQKEAMKEFKIGLAPEEEAVINKAYTGLAQLMEMLITLQELLLKSNSEYNSLKRKSKSGDEDKAEDEESIQSEGSEVEENGSEESEGTLERKRRKLSDYSNHLSKDHESFKPYRDAVVNKWNEKTRLFSGRLSKSDFSAFELSTLKQIEGMLCDRERLVRRTRLKRTDYNILGKPAGVEPNQTDTEPDLINSKGTIGEEYDPEIFDDDDFYHKLLRDFIERKATSVVDPSKLGKQWVELQKLRSKMKRKVDTRATKGRKLRYTVHNKLVNFMAAIPYSTWSEQAQSELFSSLFGQAVKAS